MPGVSNLGVRIYLELTRNALTSKLEVSLRLQQAVDGRVTTVQEGTHTIGADQLFSRLQEHLNNYLRQLVNHYTQLERINK